MGKCKAKEPEHISQLTGQDWTINCDGLRLWGPPMRGSWAIVAIQVPDRLQFFYCNPALAVLRHTVCAYIATHVSASQRDTLVHAHTIQACVRHNHPLLSLRALRNYFFLPAQFFKSLTCILLSFILPPPRHVFPPLPLSPPAVSVTCSQTSGHYIAMT